jgi:hypothetical protein
MIVSLQEAKDHLRIDNDAEDADLTLKIQASSQIILDYLRKSESDYGEDSDGILETPTSVKMACLILVGILYRDRDGEESKNWNQGYLPFSVTALIYQLRNPALS